MRALLALLLLASPARAVEGMSGAASAAAAPVCLPLAGVGCWYAPTPLSGNPPLLVYMRGHHPSYRADVPPAQALASARQAFEFYGLAAAAQAAGHVLLVTYRSGLAVSEADVRRLAAETGFTFSRRVAAVHSGAYVGLSATLAGGLALDRLLLLDCFYSGSPALAQAVQARFPTGACGGFYTPHSFSRGSGRGVYDNEANYLANFKPHAPGCPIAKRPNGEHNRGVNLCLAAYLNGVPCPAAVPGSSAASPDDVLPDASVLDEQ